MIGTFKANTVDKYLRPIRQQITELVEPNSTVVEFGCGNGDLLFNLSGKIHTGIGLDISEPLIAYCAKRKKKEGINNLEFEIKDLSKEFLPETKIDYSIASLFFHVLPWTETKELLKRIIGTSKTIIVCGFSKPENRRQNTLLWLDQRFTGHYHNYNSYKKNGFTEGLINSIENIQYTKIDTFDPLIKIYKIEIIK
ncbi:MAG: class I SAM-dependent methyltransferase [Calditrichaeota bacterium]|nr:MAG: class I SAM-dependent methyltransferase [Calditrichota bacterium]MBL1206008.1 class I SAM-dependent methyltransferase [Calditrichota bacterium]NOG45836.1 class I SAM-dependent methyltransferase [Calditrichota bacterium]